MRYTIDYNYGFLILPHSAANNPKAYSKQMIHEVFHYTPMYLEEERNNLFIEMVSVSILEKWRTILNSKVNNGEIERDEADITYKQGLNQIKQCLREKICYVTDNKHEGIIINPMFLDIVSTYCIYVMYEQKFLEILEKVNYKISYSDQEKESIKKFYCSTADRHCISINNFLSEVYSDVYMTKLCNVTPKEYIKMMANGFGFAEISKKYAGDTSILRFGFMLKTLFNCNDWREKTFNVLNELRSDGCNEVCLENLKQYVEAYNEMVGRDGDNYFENAMTGIVPKWLCNAKEIKENCRKSLDNLLNYTDVEYDALDMVETLNNDMQFSDFDIGDIRRVRLIDMRRVPCHSYAPHELYLETLHRRAYHRMFENSFSEQLTMYDANFGRCNFMENT